MLNWKNWGKMKRKFEFNYSFEREYPLYKDYPPMKREHNFHTEERFVVPWELDHNVEEYTAKTKSWE